MTLRIVTPVRITNDSKSLYIYNNYYQMLKNVGVELVIATPGSFETYNKLLEMCDGLLLTGGGDIDPKFYNQDVHPTTKIDPPTFEQMEFALISLFAKQKKPILGICRGIQTINVFFNGDIIQDIPSSHPESVEHMQDPKETYAHTVTIQKDTILSKFMDTTIKVNSYHHQNIDTVASGFNVNAISEDGLIEGIEKNNIIGVQWHPEKVDDVYQQQLLKAWLSTFTGG
ncbi:MAG: gamma-glutamyl-gamma-aminobutyrate hydrolase family protein [Coprobacillaceae bacterium]